MMHYHKKMWKLNRHRQLIQPGKFRGCAGAVPEGLVPSGPRPWWRLRLEEEHLWMDDARADAGQAEGARAGRHCKTHWNYFGMKYPRLNFIANFWAHFHWVLSFPKNSQNSLSAAHHKVSCRSPNTLFQTTAIWDYPRGNFWYSLLLQINLERGRDSCSREES